MNNKDLDKVKKIELEIMEYYDDICRKNNLTYYMFYGTLIGAVRHSGFIPWDDDIDVLMPIEDYQKLLEILKDNKNKKYYVQNIFNTKYCTYNFTKIRKYKTTMVETNLNYLKFKKGINIDIFPLYKYPKSKFGKIKFQFKSRLASLLLNRDLKGDSVKSKIIHYSLIIFPRVFLNKIIICLLNSLASYKGEYDEYRVVHYTGFPKEWFDEAIYLPFEDKEYLCPKAYHEILTQIYGDYMTPPPVEKQVGHGDGSLILSFNKEYDEL